MSKSRFSLFVPVLLLLAAMSASAAEKAVVLPDPAVDDSLSAKGGQETAVLPVDVSGVCRRFSSM